MRLKAIFKPLIFERSGKRLSLSRCQFWLAWAIFAPVYLRAAWASATVPDVPQGWVALLGVSGAIYAASKAIARQRDYDPYAYPMTEPYPYEPPTGKEPPYGRD